MDRGNILEMLAKEWGTLPQQDNEFSANEIHEFITKAGYVTNFDMIKKRLRSLEGQGILTTRGITAAGSGGRRYLYSPADGKTWEDVLQYIKVS